MQKPSIYKWFGSKMDKARILLEISVGIPVALVENFKTADVFAVLKRSNRKARVLPALAKSNLPNLTPNNCVKAPASWPV